MRNDASNSELRSLLARFETAGGVLDYIFLEQPFAGHPQACHRTAALLGIAEIDRRLAMWAVRNASSEYPSESFFRIHWDETKLAGEPVSFSTFWGTDDVEAKSIGDRAWSIPSIDGYKTAFFHPPYGLHGSPSEKAELFDGINHYVLGAMPGGAEFFSWSTNWSNYFEAGHEWWGAYYWTIRPAESNAIVVVAASSTD
jgi:hypothetical protein